jgi:hypothetical protein
MCEEKRALSWQRLLLYYMSFGTCESQNYVLISQPPVKTDFVVTRELALQ